MPGLLKIGYSRKDPIMRATELNSTGVPHNFELLYDVIVKDPQSKEKHVHEKLERFREGKEWFNCTFEDAVSAIRTVVGVDAIIECIHKNPTDTLETIAGTSSEKRETRPLGSAYRTGSINSAAVRTTPQNHTIWSSTGTFRGTCNHCGTEFSVTLVRTDQGAMCPSCFKFTDADVFVRD